MFKDKDQDTCLDLMLKIEQMTFHLGQVTLERDKYKSELEGFKTPNKFVWVL